MNEEQIDTFLVIERCGSFSRAAELLFITQPTVSHRIGALEQELGAPLFRRGPGPLALTPAGRAFLPQARRLQKDFALARRTLQPYAGKRQLIAGVPALMVQGSARPYRAIMTLPQARGRLRARILNLPQEGRRALLNGEIDLLFADTSHAVIDKEGFSRRTLFEDSAYACLHRGHRLAARPRLQLRDLAGETVLGYRDSTFFSHRMQELLRREGAAFHPSSASAQETAALLRPDYGVLLTNVRQAEDDWLVYRPLALPAAQPVGVLWRTADGSEALHAIIEAISDLPEEIWRR